MLHILDNHLLIYYNIDTGGIAQLGERLLCEQIVVGSSPITSTKYDNNWHIQQLIYRSNC